jgi:Protein of unknown function (DUF998)
MNLRTTHKLLLTATGTMERQKLATGSVAALRAAGLCGLVAFVTANIGWIGGGLAQPDSYSVANDDISDLGAVTASSSWIYNRIGANLTGLLVVALALGLWPALSPDVVGRLGAAALLAVGAGLVLDGFFQLDCRGIDAGCTNDSWHSQAHKIESGITGAVTFAAPLILAFAFRRIPAWRDSWLPSLIMVPAAVLASLVFSAVGNGASTRAGVVVFSLWIAFVSVRLLQKGTSPRQAELRPGRRTNQSASTASFPSSASSRPTSS